MIQESPCQSVELYLTLLRCHTTGLLYARAEESISTEEEVSLVPPENTETFSFQAEVHKMLDIVVNSLYQNNEVFLRELISNASDALDKLRYLMLSDPDIYKKGIEGEDNLEVQIEFDPDRQTLTIRDTGVGMTHDELVQNLGTVARSGTTKFIEALKESGNAGSTMDQIGQFGVGFYSAFLVANRVTVASKSPKEADQFVWESKNGAGDFFVYKDPRGNTLSRGTEITLHLKDDSLEYADVDRLRDLAKHYSAFVQYPISLRVAETVTMDVDDEEGDADAEKKVDEEKSDDEELEMGDESDSEDKEDAEQKQKKTKEVTTFSWERVNSDKAIWTREKDTVSDEEYAGFFSSLVGNEHEKSSAHSHFTAEGSINFKSILYLPDKIPASYRMGNMDSVEGGMRLFVRRVLISDTFELLPRYLGFVRGVVDSDDLPLNVNRETLQESKILQIIKKKLVRKAIEMIKTFASESDKENDPEEQEEEKEEDELDYTDKDDKNLTKYMKWYKKFGSNIKLGAIEDEPNRAKLMKLLRFQTSESNGKFISLDKYVENMKEWQKDIFVLGGQDAKEIEASPFLETARDKGVEVLYFTEAVDEYMVRQVSDYNKHKFVHLSSEGVKFKDEDEDLVKRRRKVYDEKFGPLMKWMRSLYQGSVLRVQIAKRGLGSVPAIVSSSDFGNSANLERIMRAQAFQHGMDETSYRALKVLEINPRHPLILKLLDGMPKATDEPNVDEPEVEQDIMDAAWMIHDIAMLNGGFPVADAQQHNKRLLKALKRQFGLESLKLEPEIDPPIEEEQPPEENVDLDGLDPEDIMSQLNMDEMDLDLDGEAKPSDE